jgi:hypothetical protein
VGLMKNVERRGETYVVRVAIPQDMRHAFGKSAIIESLRTKDQVEAIERAAPVIAAIKRRIVETRRRPRPRVVSDRTGGRPETRISESAPNEFAIALRDTLCAGDLIPRRDHLLLHVLDDGLCINAIEQEPGTLRHEVCRRRRAAEIAYCQRQVPALQAHRRGRREVVGG